MSEENFSREEKEYIAFISYRHKPLDMEAARLIQKKIEGYTVPKEFRQKYGKKLGKVFRDEDELTASSSLSESILEALDQSEYLIVICTPDLPQSSWCEQEIRYFLSTHDRDKLIAVLADGDPETSFPDLLKYTYDDAGNIIAESEPLAANIASPSHRIDKKALNKEIVRIYAVLLNCPFDALWQRERRARTNRLMMAFGAVFAVMAVIIGIVLNRNAEISRKNVEIQRQNVEISDKNLEITEKNDELKSRISSILVDSGLNKLAEYDVDGALEDGLSALLDDDSRSLADPRAEYLLSKAVGAYTYEEYKSRLIYEQTGAIDQIAVTEDGRYALISDTLNMVKCLELPEGKIVWEHSLYFKSEEVSTVNPPADLIILDDLNAALVKNPVRLSLLDLDTGEEKWRYEYQMQDGNHFRCLSHDKSTAVILDKEDADAETLSLILLDTASGKVLKSLPLFEEGEEPVTNHYLPWYNYAGDISDNGRYLGLMYYASDISSEDDSWSYFNNRIARYTVFDLKTGEKAYSLKREESRTNIRIFGLQMTDEGDMLAARYSHGYGHILITLIRKEELEGKDFSFDHTIGTVSGMSYDYPDYDLVLPMLVSDRHIFIASESFLYVFGRKDGEIVLRKRYGFTGKVIELAFDDREEERVYLRTAYGAVSLFDFGNEDVLLESYGVEGYDQTAVYRTASLSREAQENTGIQFLTVSGDDPGRLLTVSRVSDMNRESMSFDEDKTHFYYEQGADVFLISLDDGENVWMTVCDAETKKVLGSVSDDYFPYGAVPGMIGKDRILLGDRIYSLDGSVEELPWDTWISASRIRQVRLKDGRLLTALDGSWGNYSSFYIGETPDRDPVWIDGEVLEASKDPASSLCFFGTDIFELSSSGYVLGHGSFYDESKTGKTAEDEINEDKAFVSLNTSTGKRTVIPDGIMEPSLSVICTMGKKTPVYACTDNRGNVVFGDLEEGTVRKMNIAYDDNEILGMTLAADDEALIFLLKSGQLDIWSAANEERIASLKNELLEEYVEAYSGLYSGAFILEETFDEESGRSYLSVKQDTGSSGKLLVIDTASWTIVQEASGINAVLSCTGELVMDRSEETVFYPIYSREDIRKMAEESLNK